MKTKEEIERLKLIDYDKCRHIQDKLNEVIERVNELSSPEKKEEVDNNCFHNTTADSNVCLKCSKDLDVVEDYEEEAEEKFHCGRCGKEIYGMSLSGEWVCEDCEKQETTQELTKEELRIIRNACRVREEYADASEYKFLCEIALKIEKLLK